MGLAVEQFALDLHLTDANAGTEGGSDQKVGRDAERHNRGQQITHGR